MNSEQLDQRLRQFYPMSSAARKRLADFIQAEFVDPAVVAAAIPVINAHMNALRDGIAALQRERDDREALWQKYRDSGALTHEPRKP